jgi:hypothetical protein
MIRSYARPRLKDTTRLKSGQSKDLKAGRCARCREPLIVLHNFSSAGHIAVCGNRDCPLHAQPQKHISHPRFVSEQSDEKLASGICDQRKQRKYKGG